jgi:hypothetical protein
VTHNERIVLVEYADVLHKSRLDAVADRLVAFVSTKHSQALQNPTCTGVHNEYWSIKGVEQHVVRRLGADAVDTEQNSTPLTRFQCTQAIQSPRLQVGAAKGL